MLSHMGGIINPDIVKISSYCKKNKITLIEDCAHSFGSTLNNKHQALLETQVFIVFIQLKLYRKGVL